MVEEEKLLKVLWVSLDHRIGILNAEKTNIDIKFAKIDNKILHSLEYQIGCGRYDTFYIWKEWAYYTDEIEAICDFIKRIGGNYTILFPEKEFPAIIVMEGSENKRLFFVVAPTYNDIEIGKTKIKFKTEIEGIEFKKLEEFYEEFKKKKEVDDE